VSFYSEGEKMSKRTYGEGALYYDENKKIYRAMLYTPLGNRMTKSSKDLAIVEDWINEQRLLIGRNQHVEPQKLTLLSWLMTWVEVYSKPNIRQRTYERNLSLIYHVEQIGDIALQKLSPDHLQNLYNAMQEEGFSGETRKKVHQLIHNALKQAQINRLIYNNPADLVKPPKATRDEIQVFTPEQISLLLEHAKPNRFYPALLLAVTSGMRLGEILGVRWQDIDMTNNEVFVRQNLQSTNQQGIIFEPPKTVNGKRKITIPVQTINVLREHKKVWNESRLKYPGTNDLVFVTKTHTPISPQNFLKRFWNRLQMNVEFAMNNFEAKPMNEKKKLQVILDECRLKKGWKKFDAKNFHVLRHTYATTLLASGVPIIDVSRALGHAKVSTTLDIYGHAIPENKKLIADKISLAFLE
jgi:integrase